MIENNKKIKNSLYIVLVIVLVAVFFYLYLLKIVKNKQNGELLFAIYKLQEMELAQQNFLTNDKLLRETKVEREKLDSFVINKKTISNLIEEIETLGKHANVELNKTLSVEKNTQRPKESLLKFSIRVKGGFKDVYYFALLIENIPYKIRVKRMSLATSVSGVSSAISGIVDVSGNKTKSTQKEETWTGDINFELLSYINE
ncbi:MAG: hypothetical protein UT05_C0003G0016 [Parcubacteria group bacterium GW2011_GWF2_38_76]|nr:MAG: hypothetical protein UT05_C0003G0016 [Parcubacteria group bacterium GW2011_GWF2_38_76]HBM46210.1 hypothetical protein [Patescibacteria group bacterium]